MRDYFRKNDPIRFLFPIDGDCVNERDGVSARGAVQINARVAAPEGPSIIIGGEKAEWKDGCYTATVEIPDKLSVLSLKNFIISREPRNKYVCEFHNVEQFLSVLITLRSDFKIVEPMWIRERLVKLAENIIKNNKF